MLEVKRSGSKVVIVWSVITVALVAASAVKNRTFRAGEAKGCPANMSLKRWTPAMCVPLQVIVMVCVWRHGDGLDWMVKLRGWAAFPSVICLPPASRLEINCGIYMPV